jgi:four helix bundle protein
LNDFGFWILDFGLIDYWQINCYKIVSISLYFEAILNMDEQQFKKRTKQLGLRIIRLVESLPPKTSAQVIGKQLLRSATSVGANYRAACRAKSTADILHKLAIVEEEADETLYWLEMLVEAELVPESKLNKLMAETNEIISMIVASIKTIRTQNKNSSPKSKIQNLKSKIPYVQS